MLKCKKITAFFLACLMLLGTIVPIGEAFAQGANHLSKTRISRIEVKDQNGNTIDLNEKIEEDKDCRLEIDWDASEYGADIKKETILMSLFLKVLRHQKATLQYIILMECKLQKHK